MSRTTTLVHRLLLTLLGVFCGVGAAVAQFGPYGNEWTQPNQPYYKIKVGQRGIHRLTAAWLSAAGVPVATLDPHRLQLWRRGQEQAIYVAGEADGRFDATDYIDFWGQLNDGRLDAELYKTPAEQLSHLAPIYADTAAYFLTIAPGTAANRRMQEQTSTPGTLTPLRYHLSMGQSVESIYYFQGPDYGDVFLPWLDKSEGYLSSLFGLSPNVTSGDFTVTLGSNPDTTHLVPRIEIGMTAMGYNSANVEVVLLRGTGATATVIRTLGTITVPPYGNAVFRGTLRYADFNAAGQISYRLRATNAAPAGTLVGVAYARVWGALPTASLGRTRLVMTDSTVTGGQQYLLFDIPPPQPLAYDVTDPTTPIRYRGNTTGTQWGVVIATPTANTRNVFLASDATPLLPPAGTAITFRNFQPQPGAYLIVTGTKLLTDTLGNHPVRDYAMYRASAVGGGYDTVVVTSSQLYDQFHYGDASPNAIRRFVSFMNSGSAPAGFLFLLGKGYQPEIKASVLGTKVRNRNFFRGDIVPAFGFPGSDIMYSADFRAGNYAPRVPTGRLAAVSTADVIAYLNKVQEHEAAPVAAWRKEILHLGGGRLLREQRDFSQYLRNYAARVENDVYFGGHVSSIVRGNSGQTVSNINVSTQINRGLTMMTFFGHSSTSVSDIEIGLASDPVNNYRNRGRYPLMLMNGCTSGNAFQQARSFGEDWVLTPERGAIAFLAHASDGLADRLNLYSDAFYTAAFNDSTTYGKPLGIIQRRAIELAAANPAFFVSTAAAQAQLTEMVLQADPAVRLFSPDKPDYFIADSTVSLTAVPGDRLTARADSIQLVVRIRNYGKATLDPVPVQVRRTHPRAGGGSVVTTTQHLFSPVFFADTLVIRLPNPDSAAAQGLNTFEVSVDWANAIPELNEANNLATVRYNFPSGSVFALFPPEYAIVPTATPSLFGQYDQALAQPRQYIFELATEPTFANTSSFQRQVVTAGRFPAWQPTLPAIAGRDSVVWFWRFRPETIQAGEDSAWAVSSFRRIATSLGGWSQSHYGQFKDAKKQTISQDTPSGIWSYSPASLRLELRTVSGDSARFTTAGATFAVPPNGIVYNQSSRTRGNPSSRVPNLLMMIFNPRTLIPLTNRDALISIDSSYCFGQESDPNVRAMFQAVKAANGGIGTVQVPLISQASPTAPLIVSGGADTLARLIGSIPPGYIVAMISANRVPFDEIRAQKPNLLAAIAGLGSSLIDSLHSGDPFVFIGRQGAPRGTAIERTYDRTLPRRWGQTVVLDTTQMSFVPSGTITSTVVGPAQQWRTVFHSVRRPINATSEYQLTVIPLDSLGREGTRIPVTSPTDVPFSLSSLNARQYPKLRLEMTSRDTLNRQAPQLKQWLVTYDEVPEAIVRTDLVPASALDLTSQVPSGSVRLEVPFQNISTVRFRDSIVTEFVILQMPARNQIGTAIRVKTKKLGPDSLDRAAVQVPVASLPSGDYRLQATVNPNHLQPERYDFNNYLEASFQVVNPNLAPLIDVAFDGQHILHGDIVAPSPVITISVRDEDHQRPIDPSQITMVLTRPGQPSQQIMLPDAHVQIHPATSTRPLELTYEPGRLTDGVYRLQVQATDQAGNRAGADFYDSEFKVINQTMISNFYPYPNPFSTSTRFLFTITGKVPQNLKIQIMTVTGRVVREITKEELGTDLRVGNNTSTSTWNGTDEYGDQLANGVYLYRVVVQDDAEDFKSYKTAGDSKAFHKNWGKLYILR
jgi:Peptidase family C25/Interleukin-like EMT inducer